MTNKTAIYPGTFDPITNGHTDLVVRAAQLFDRVIVAIVEEAGKDTAFSAEDRVAMAETVLANMGNVEVRSFSGLLVDYARENDVAVILRGLRAVSDFEYEFQMAGMNRRLDPEIETMFLTPAEQYTFISSSLVREIARLGGDVGEFVHASVAQRLVALRENGS